MSSLKHDLAVDRAPAPASGADRGRSFGQGAGFLAVAFALGVTLMGNNIPTPLYPEYQLKFGFSTGMLTVIFAVAAAGVLPSLLLIGPLSDRLGRRPVLLFALGMVALSTSPNTRHCR